jgi:hypothetical protein
MGRLCSDLLVGKGGGLNRGQPLQSWVPGFPHSPRAVRGKFCAGKKWRIATSAFVLAGLDPAIHACDACNEDVGTRDKPAQDGFALSSTEFEHAMLEAGASPDSPARSRE